MASATPAFESYFRRFGVASVGWPDLPHKAEVLGTINPSRLVPAALKVPVGKGVVYLLPYEVADFSASHEELVLAIVEGIEGTDTDEADELPDYLAELRLPGEEDLLADIETREAELAAVRAQANRLERFRHLLGGYAGEQLEELVVEALNVVLEDSGFEAYDEPDTFAEDFWILHDEERFALAEVKGINTGAKRAHVNQVDNHREALDFEPADLPGLLVLNVHRGDMTLDRKVGEVVHPSIVAQLRRQNVLLLRTADVYALLQRRLAGAPASEQLIEGLRGGGGWLEVTATAVTLHDGG